MSDTTPADEPRSQATETTFNFFEREGLPGPTIRLDEAARLAAEWFGVEGTARALGSQQDANFAISPPVPDDSTEPESGPTSVLKLANPAFSLVEIEAQDAATRHLAERDDTLRLPLSLPAPSGASVVTGSVAIGDDSEQASRATLTARLLTHLDGGTLSGPGYLAPAVVAALGDLAARVVAGLADFEHPGTVRVLQWDLVHAAAVVERLAGHVADPGLRGRVLTAARAAAARLERVASELPKQVIHGDVSDDNVVCRRADDGSRVPDGVIDFGDVMTSWRVAELAVAVSSILHHAGATPESTLTAVAAFAARVPLSDAEVEALWPLVVLRGAVLVVSGHEQAAIDADNEYATSALDHERRIFESATAVPSSVMTGLIRATLGTDGSAAAELPAVPVIGTPLVATGAGVATVDLSVTSDDLDEGRWLDPSSEATAAARLIAAGRGSISAVRTEVGAARLSRSVPLQSGASATVPLGMDVYLDSVQPVLAPWDGILERTDSAIELRHAGGARLILRGCQTGSPSGTAVTAGGEIGWTTPLGDGLSRVSAQLFLGRDDDLDVDVPEFVTPAMAAGWRSMSPDPAALFGLAAAEARQVDELLERRAATFASVQEHYYSEPPRIERGWKHHLVDDGARCYLDMVNNVAAVGHAHPRIASAVYRQLSKLNTNSRFNYGSVVELSERLVSLLPEKLDTVFLVNSGSEADDLALRIAWAWTGRRDVVAVREAYHGWTDATDAISTSVADNPDALSTRPNWVHTVAAPNSYRGDHRGEDAWAYGYEAASQIRELAADGKAPAAFLAEAYYGNAGGMPLPDGYLTEVYDAVREVGGLCIADEVQVGYGRLGQWFWGFEQQGVVPDIVTTAKAMGNGHPLGAVITTREIADHYRNQGYFFSSAGGSPVSSVVGLTVLDIVRDEDLQRNALEIGEHLRNRLLELKDRHDLIGAVHGNGLYQGLEFVLDRETLEPATAETTRICDRMLELGVIIQPTGDRQNILKIKPPLCLDRAGADFFVDGLDRVVRESFSREAITRSGS